MEKTNLNDLQVANLLFKIQLAAREKEVTELELLLQSMIAWTGPGPESIQELQIAREAAVAYFRHK